MSMSVWSLWSCCCCPCGAETIPTECCNPIVDGAGNTLVDGNGNCIMWAPCEGCSYQVTLLGDDVLLNGECITIGV